MPDIRRLQVFTLDPSAENELELASVSRSILPIEWEDSLIPGPIGEYLEVIDYDPSTGCFYTPVNLNDHLATDGKSPSVSDPEFHQQMVYAIAMKTIKTFEHVLGRSVIWSERVKGDDGNYIRTVEDRFVQRLRLYPHALRAENAYYSPGKKAILFGYYNARPSHFTDSLPGGIAFTCLSHDIVVHEVTHAILDSVHPKLMHNSNPDMLAFHEGFADIVAIFQHFALPDLLLKAIQNTRGNLQNDNLLTNLAVQFARTTGRGEALRTALGSYENGVRKPPKQPELAVLFEPHERGAILVAAIFDAFLLIYDARVKDLRRIASNGTGILAEGEIPPDLAARFSSEAVKISQRVLGICIRAIDYLPPVDITFGDYFRALITADRDAVPNDKHHYRIAFIESFKEKGIYPFDVRSLSEDALRWRRTDELSDFQLNRNKSTSIKTLELWSFLPPLEVLRTMVMNPNLGDSALKDMDKYEFKNLEKAAEYYLSETWKIVPFSKGKERNTRKIDREKEFQFSRFNAIFIHKWIEYTFNNNPKELQDDFCKHLAIDCSRTNKQKFEVLSVRKLTKPKPDGISSVELFVSLAKRTLETLTDENGKEMVDENGEPLTFFFRSGCTLIVDPNEGRVRYLIKKNHLNIIKGDSLFSRLERQRAFYRQQIAYDGNLAIKRYGLTASANDIRSGMEAFCMVHDHASKVY